jgi:hypothetical protein
MTFFTGKSKDTQPSKFRITGRIRDQNRIGVKGFTVQAFDKDLGIYLHPDDRLGKDHTDEDGYFEIQFDSSTFKDWFEDYPNVYLVIRDEEGKSVITTEAKKNSTGRVDFQVELGVTDVSPLEPDIYSGNFDRMRTAFQNLGDSVDLSNNDIQITSNFVLGAIGSWTLYRDELARSGGYDGIQVPKIPRKEKHDHVTRWDEEVLPV